MKTLLLATALVASSAAPRASIPPSGPSSVLVTIAEVRDPRGVLYANLCRQSEFMTARCFMARHQIVAEPGAVMIRFDNVPPGIYAVQVMQDINGNRRLDRDSWGAPSEPSGVSGTMPVGRAPSFQASAFRHGTAATRVRVDLR